MENVIQIINQQEVMGKDFKVYGDWDNPLFLAKDVAEWIEYDGRSGQLLNTVDSDEKLKHTIYASGQNREMWFLTEDGLYEVLMQSRKQIAKAFKKEVKQILRSIRKNGGYIKEELFEKLQKSEKTATEYLRKLKAEQQSLKDHKELNKINSKIIRLKDKHIKLLNERLEEVIPEAEYCEMILESQNTIPFSVIAKDYGYTAVKFNQLLHKCNIQYKVGSTWLLYSQYQNCGYTKTTTYEVEDKIVSVSTQWTQRGRRFIYDTLKEYGIIPENERKPEIGQLFLGGEWYE